MATNTSVVIHHKKSFLKAKKQREKDIDEGMSLEDVENRDRLEKVERDKKALKIKLTPELESLAKKHRIDPALYGNETTELVLFLEEERIANERKKEQGFTEPPPSRSFGFREARPMGNEWKLNSFGGEGRFNEVAMRSAQEESRYRYQQIGEHFDPFYDCSVRDTLEQSHYDGFHSQSSVAPSVYSTATGTGTRASKASQSIAPILPVYFIEAIDAIPGAQEKLNEVALDEARNRYGKSPKKKITPYENPYVYSKFSKGGTYLHEFEESSLKSDVDKAMAKYKDAQNEAMMVEGYDPILVNKLGGDEKVEKLSKSFVDFSVKVRGRVARRGAFLDFSADLIEACNRFNLTKVIVLLHKGEGDPNSMMSDSEPLFTHLIVKALSMDAIANSVNLTDPPSTGDRLKLQQILDEFVKYEVNINVWRGNGLSALHTAAQAGNAKMVKWLLDRGADPRPPSKRETMTPLMFACRFGHINVMSELIRVLGVECLTDTDPNGFTALHFCAASGQTRACVFLLDVGCDKRALDLKARTAARVAQDNNHMATSQAISCQAYGHVTGQQYLSFIDAQMRVNDSADSSSGKYGNFTQRFWNAADNFRKTMAAGFAGFFSRGSGNDDPNRNRNRGGLLYRVKAFVVGMFTPLPPPSRRGVRVVPVLESSNPAPQSAGSGRNIDMVRPFDAAG
jgi:hypothetical protein